MEADNHENEWNKKSSESKAVPYYKIRQEITALARPVLYHHFRARDNIFQGKALVSLPGKKIGYASKQKIKCKTSQQDPENELDPFIRKK
jgi:hypothetical protein